jgi:hypothetical protein
MIDLYQYTRRYLLCTPTWAGWHEVVRNKPLVQVRVFVLKYIRIGARDLLVGIQLTYLGIR